MRGAQGFGAPRIAINQPSRVSLACRPQALRMTEGERNKDVTP